MAEAEEIRRELDTARVTIATQAMRIQRLEADAEERTGHQAVAELLQLSDVVGTIIGETPYRALLEGIVNAAAKLFDAGAASIALVDQGTNELVFEAASGSQDIVGLRFPANQGIAGWVAMTGQPLAVSDVRADPRFAKDFAQSTGYVPASILAVPLIVQEEVEGVLEVLDKQNATSFGLDDMDLLALFARPAALAVEQARLVTGMGRLMAGELRRLSSERGGGDLVQVAEQMLSDGSVSAQAIELARLVHHLSRRGDRARQLVLELLEAVSRYTQPSRTSG